MISFNLTCDLGHIFEGWFSSSSDYDDQQERGLVSCPYCQSGSVKKALMTPNVTAKSNQKATSTKMLDNAQPHQETAPTNPAASAKNNSIQSNQMMAQISPEMQEKMGEALAEMRKFQQSVETHCDDVGEGFATEARKIHYGEAEPRGIYGRTTDTEAEELVDEGIEITKMPWLPKEH